MHKILGQMLQMFAIPNASLSYGMCENAIESRPPVAAQCGTCDAKRGVFFGGGGSHRKQRHSYRNYYIWWRKTYKLLTKVGMAATFLLCHSAYFLCLGEHPKYKGQKEISDRNGKSFMICQHKFCLREMLHHT